FVPSAPPADISATFRLTGRRLPQPAGRLDFELAPGSFDGKPLGGRGMLVVDGRRLADADLALTLAGNRIEARGRYGRPGDALALRVDAPAL
ncbi:hypothetical protein, partial [Salmonella enterica]|uniref:hypothetical protein n=1 Tax=Salmonella enterica TaxID=28901 RepID=UPI003CF45498